MFDKTKQMKVDSILFYGAQVKIPVEMKRFWRRGYSEKMGYTCHLDHVTLGHKSNMTVENLLQMYMNQGEVCEMTIDAVGLYILPEHRGEVIAFRVKDNMITVDNYPMRGENKVFHITAFTSGEARPKDANLITEWVGLSERRIKGIIRFWLKEEER